MVNQALINRFAFEAACTMVYRSLVFMVPSRASETATEVGSGTVILTPAGYPVILTAWHVAEDANKGPLTFGYQFCQHGLDNAAERVYEAPNKVDVGVVVPKPEAAAVLLEFARPATIIASPSDTGVGENTQCILGGYPAAFEAKRTDHEAKIKYQMFASATLDCVVTGIDARGRYELHWEERSFSAPPLPPPFDKIVGPELRAPRVLPSPRGMSGGALWRFEVSPAGTVWSPTGWGKIVGVQCSWDQVNTAFAESVTSWGDWFLGVLADVDELREKARKKGET